MEPGRVIELSCHRIAGSMISFGGLIILGGLVLIRTVISYFIGRERADIARELAAGAPTS